MLNHGASSARVRGGLLGVLLCASTLLGACGDGTEPSRPGPGTLTAELRSPNGAEGAALFALVGPGVSVSALEGEFESASSGDTTRVLVIREAAGDIRFRVSMPDTTQPPAVTVLQ
ncbi:MAG: hypothetical protein D6701_02865, partial [Gemmatimonadetes bacterium]